MTDTTRSSGSWRRRRAESPSRFHEVAFEGVSDAIILASASGVVLDVNPAAEQLFELPRQQVTGLPVRSLVDRVAASAELATRVERAIESGVGSAGQVRVHLGSATERTCEAAVLPVADAAATPVACVVVLSDVTSRTRGERRAQVLADVLDESRNEIYLFDAGTLRFEHVNRAARENLKYSLAELRRLTPLDLKPAYTRESFARLLEPLRRGETDMLRFETVHRRSDGTHYPIDVHLQLSTRGERPLFAALILDLTERQRAEEAAREAAERLRAVVATAVDGIITIDETGVMETVNPAAERIFGYTIEEMTGRNVSMLMPQPYRGEHDGYLARYRATGERRVVGIGRELVGRRKDGTLFPMELAVSETVLDDRRFFTGIVRDITERKRAQEQERDLIRENSAREAAERGEQRARFMASISHLLAASLDPEETLRQVAGLLVPSTADWCVIDLLRPSGEVETVQSVAWTPELEARLRRELAQYPRAENPAHPLTQVITSGMPKLIAVTDEVLVSIARDTHHLAMLRALGHASTVIVPLTSRGRTLGAVTLARSTARRAFSEGDLALAVELGRRAGVAIENAELHAAEQHARTRAESATRARDHVLGIVAHDLRSPLSCIPLFARVLEAHELPQPALRALAGIKRAVEQTESLIGDLLDVSRIEAGALRVEPEPVHVADLLREIDEPIGLKAHEQGIQWSVRCEPDHLWVEAEPTRVQQVLHNLLENALRFTSTGGQVELRVEAGDDEVIFVVADTGRGIPADALPHLFDRFYQTPATRPGGVGLGLAIARGIVEAHGGRIWVESEEGRGSTFRFALPSWVEADPEEGAAADRVEAEPVAPAREVRVLLADDHAMMLRALEALLRRDPWVRVVGTAATGEEAVRLAEQTSPDVVLMDLRMPGLDGVRATRQITRANPDVRVLALTADAEEESLLPLLAAGGSGYLQKTHAPDDLLAALHAVSRGELFLYPSGYRLLLGGFRDAAQAQGIDLLETLTDREREIVRLVAEGFTSREIGSRLFLSPHTIESYRGRLMRRLGLSHRAEVVQFALRTGLLQPD